MGEEGEMKLWRYVEERDILNMQKNERIYILGSSIQFYSYCNYAVLVTIKHV